MAGYQTHRSTPSTDLAQSELYKKAGRQAKLYGRLMRRRRKKRKRKRKHKPDWESHG
jgi:hypothetical protein